MAAAELPELLDDARQGLDGLAFALRHLDRALAALPAREGGHPELRGRLPGLRAAFEAVEGRARGGPGRASAPPSPVKAERPAPVTLEAAAANPTRRRSSTRARRGVDE